MSTPGEPQEASAPPWSTEEVELLDGSTATLRPVTPGDSESVADLFDRASTRSRYLRFHHEVNAITPAELVPYVQTDGANRFGVVAVLPTPDGERVVGIGHYFRTGTDIAEVAFLIDDEHQHLGIATHILRRLIEVARAHGIKTFEADVLGENKLMIEVFQACGYPVHTVLKYGEVHITVAIGRPPEPRNSD
jgi:GNAT superfamily N-acetyltransferase